MAQMYNFDVTILPPAALLAEDFAIIGLQIKSFREPLKRSIQQVMAPSFAKNFDVGGRPSWVPLADATLADKEAQGYPDDILIRTGKLKRVAQQLNIWNISSDEAYVDNLPGADYGFFHEGGTQFMPQRIFMDVTEQDEDDIANVFENWIGERFASRGIV